MLKSGDQVPLSAECMDIWLRKNRRQAVFFSYIFRIYLMYVFDKLEVVI